jgi:hypothetical protein
MPSPIPDLALAQKSLLVGVGWSNADTDGVMQFSTPLAIDGLTFRGLELRGRCYAHHPDRSVMFQVEVAPPGKRSRIPLVRLEWRPLAEPHRNPPGGDPELSRRLIFGSHFHPFELNWVGANDAMRSGNLPFAKPLENDPGNFAELIDTAGVLLRINHLDQIQAPSWMERLL